MVNPAILYLLMGDRTAHVSGFAGHRASFLMENIGVFTHIYLNPRANRQHMIQAMKANGDNCSYIYLTNQGDYGGNSVNPCPVDFAHPDWGLSLDEAKMQRWEGQIQDLINAGLPPIFWLFADDSQTISRKSSTRLAHLTSLLVKRFDKYAIGYVPALEADEHMSLSKVAAILTAIHSNSSKETGMHLTPMAHRDHLDYTRLCDWYFLQIVEPDRRISIEYAKAAVQEAILMTGNINIVAAEYWISSSDDYAKNIGDACMAAGALATGNGRH